MSINKPIHNFRDLKIYTLSYELALKIFKLSQKFPKEELYSLTSQIRRSSRSVPGNIREGFAKRKYENIFIRHLIDALGSAEETRTWLELSRDCGYITGEEFEKFDRFYDEVSAMLFTLFISGKNSKGRKMRRLKKFDSVLCVFISAFCFLPSVFCARGGV